MKRAAIGLVLLVVLAIAACGGSHAPPEPASSANAPPRRIANLHAFARLYGVVRWFHPSDAASAIDWDRFAIDGARRVVDAPDATALRDDLRALIAPIAPTARIAGPGEPLADDPALHPSDPRGLDVIAWEHLGFGDSAIASVYHSKRRHRPRTERVAGDQFAAVSQTIDATPYRGKRVRLRARVRTAPGATGEMWLRVDVPGGVGFFDNMMNRPIRSTAWSDAEIVGEVDARAQRIVFGALENDGGAWFDDVELAADDGHGGWQPIAIADPGFESADPLASWNAGIARGQHGLAGWNATADRDRPNGGAQSLHIAPETTTITDELFDDAPRAGETVDVDLGGGLRARVPIALYAKDGRTIGDDPELARRSQAAATPAPAGFDPIAGVADAIVAWNVLEHFWPYFDVAPVDWNAELDAAIADALDDRSADDHVATLERLAAAAPDGHAHVSCAGATPEATPAIALDWIEGQAVVVASQDDRVKPGDVVATIDGRAAAVAIADAETRISGSPQWKRVLAMNAILEGPIGSNAALRLRRAGAGIDVSIARAAHGLVDRLPVHPPIDALPGGVMYVDLSKASAGDVEGAMDRLVAAPGVVFDLRGYPTDAGAAILGHLIGAAEDAKWMSVAHVIRPDHAPPPAWEPYGWSAAPTGAHIGGRVAFLTGGGAISYAESVMGYVADEKLGTIVGEPTAGTNGNIAAMSLPTGCTETFTGMRVTRHDGSRRHLIGERPAIAATRTIAGVAAGTDEALDKAVASVIVK